MRSAGVCSRGSAGCTSRPGENSRVRPIWRSRMLSCGPQTPMAPSRSAAPPSPTGNLALCTGSGRSPLSHTAHDWAACKSGLRLRALLPRLSHCAGDDLERSPRMAGSMYPPVSEAHQHLRAALRGARAHLERLHGERRVPGAGALQSKVLDGGDAVCKGPRQPLRRRGPLPRRRLDHRPQSAGALCQRSLSLHTADMATNSAASLTIGVTVEQALWPSSTETLRSLAKQHQPARRRLSLSCRLNVI